MSGQGYVQTILIDCNRISSIEYNASKLSKTNNALYTNKVSDGITLDIGDKVSVESAHIAQRGAGSSVIEFGGEVLGHKNVSYCETVSSSYIGFGPASADSSSYAQQSPTGYAYETSSIVTEEVPIKDNEVSIVIDYYKNTNGENYITLPRNHGNWGANQGADGTNASLKITGYPSSSSTSPNDQWWAVPDGHPVGCQSLTGKNVRNICFDDFRFQVVRNFQGQDSTTCKLKNDNSRYTLFKKTEVVWNASKVSNSSLTAFIKGIDLVGIPPDPAIHEYIRFKEKKVISVDQGYNSPSNIASNITDELVETDNPITVNYGLRTEDGTGLNEFGTGQIVNSALHKAIPCANYSTFNSSTNLQFFNASVIRDAPPWELQYNEQVIGVGATSLINTRSSNYLASYAYVGFKRPDFIETGRATGTHAGYQIKKLVAQASATSAVYETDIPWTEDNLTKFSRFFDTQKNLYPELLNGGLDIIANQDSTAAKSQKRTEYASFNTTSSSLSASFRDEARFLHIGLADNLAVTLGNDNYNSSGTLGSVTINVSDLSSTPIFIYFNKNCSDLTADQTIGDRYDNLAHGYARQWTSGADKFIAFTTELIGGVNASYFDFQDPKALAVGTRIGYDYHFNAYGNAAIMPSSGYFPLGFYGQQGGQSASLIRNTYIGADNPLFNFNSIENRFEISNLHTPEKVGNFYNAGAPNGFNDNLAPPASAQSSEDCYKLNKQLNYSTWSPSMFPYPAITHTQASQTSGKDPVTFIEVNENLEPGAIFDSRSGVTILDSGVDETNFERSLWGTLGFQYSQFNTSGSNILNSNTRFTEDITNVSGLTTNANIISTTAVNYPQNAWGVQTFTAQINGGINYYNASLNLNSSWVNNTPSASYVPSHIIRPPSTIIATSTTIAANKLPRKLKTGYFTLSSDILDQTGWYHTANPMSVLASVGKYSAENDFVEYGGGGAEFTVTRKKTITNITSQILDPEGKLAQVGDNSGIIYRIDKQINTDLNFAKSVMEGVYTKK